MDSVKENDLSLSLLHFDYADTLNVDSEYEKITLPSPRLP